MSDISECQDEGIISKRRREAEQAIQDVLDTPPRDRHQIVDFGECAIVRLRDCLIEKYRAAEDSEEKKSLRTALDQANVALSLISGVEYPGSGIQERPMNLALGVLKSIVV